MLKDGIKRVTVVSAERAGEIRRGEGEAEGWRRDAVLFLLYRREGKGAWAWDHVGEGTAGYGGAWEASRGAGFISRLTASPLLLHFLSAGGIARHIRKWPWRRSLGLQQDSGEKFLQPVVDKSPRNSVPKLGFSVHWGQGQRSPLARVGGKGVGWVKQARCDSLELPSSSRQAARRSHRAPSTKPLPRSPCPSTALAVLTKHDPCPRGEPASYSGVLRPGRGTADVMGLLLEN